MAWHQAVGGRTILADLLSGSRRSTREGTVLYHAFFPHTRVMHVLMADVGLLTNPPTEPILGLAPQDDHPELDGILSSMLMAANDLADEFGEEHRRPQDVTPGMRALFQTRFTHHLGADRLNGRSFQARAGIGIPGPAGWVLHGWSLTA